MMRTGCHRHMRSTAWRAREALRGGRACVPVILVNGHRNCTWAADIQRLLSRPRDDGSGSGTAGRYITMTGGSTAHTCRSRLDGSCALFNSHSIESLELRQSAKSGPSSTPRIAVIQCRCGSVNRRSLGLCCAILATELLRQPCLAPRRNKPVFIKFLVCSRVRRCWSVHF